MPILSKQHIQTSVVVDVVPVYSSKGTNVPYCLRPPSNCSLSIGMSIRTTGDSFLPLFKTILILFLSSEYKKRVLVQDCNPSLHLHHFSCFSPMEQYQLHAIHHADSHTQHSVPSTSCPVFPQFLQHTACPFLCKISLPLAAQYPLETCSSGDVLISLAFKK